MVKSNKSTTQTPAKSTKKDSGKKADKKIPRKTAKELSDETRDDHEAVVRIVQRNFKYWKHRQLHKVLVNGKSLWKTLLDAVKAARERGGNVSAGAINTFRGQFKAACGTSKSCTAVQIEDESQEVRFELQKAIAITLMANPGKKSQRGQLYGVLEMLGEDSINQKEFLTVLGSFHKMNPSLVTDAQHIMKVVKIMVSKRWDTRFAKEFESLQDSLDQSCVTLLCVAMKKTEMPDWWKDNRAYLGSLVKTADVDAIIAAGENFYPHSAKILEFTGNRKLGMSMFADKLTLCVKWDFSKKVNAIVAELDGQTPIPKESLAAVKEKLLSSARDMSAKTNHTDLKYSITLGYKERQLPFEVPDVYSHIMLALACYLKDKSAGYKDGIDLMIAEAILNNNAKDIVACPVPKESLREYAAGRSAFNKLVATNEAASSKQMQDIMSDEFSYLLSEDKTIIIEKTYLEWLCDEGAEQEAKIKILDLLPSEKRRVTWEEAEAKFELFKKTQLWTFLPENQRGELNSSWELVEQARDGELEKDAFQAFTGFDKQVADRLVWFAEENVFEQKGKLDSTKLLGINAINHWVSVLLAGGKDEGKRELMAKATSFQFLWPDDKEEALNALGYGVLHSAPSATASAKKKAKTSTVEKTDYEHALDQVQNLFKLA